MRNLNNPFITILTVPEQDTVLSIRENNAPFQYR